MSPTIWWAAGCRSAGRTKSSGRWCGLLAEGREFSSLTLGEWREASDRFDADIVDRVTARQSVAAKRTPQSTAPDRVAAALAEVGEWLDARSAG